MKKKAFVILCVLLLSSSFSVMAKEETGIFIDIDETSDYYLRSDGQDGDVSSYNTDDYYYNSSDTSMQLSQQEQSTSQKLNRIRSDFNSIRGLIKEQRQESFYGNYFGNLGNNQLDILTFGATPLTREEYAQILNDYLDYKHSLTDESYHYDHILAPEFSLRDLTEGTFSSLSAEDKKLILSAIIMNENGGTNFSKDALYQFYYDLVSNMQSDYQNKVEQMTGNNQGNLGSNGSNGEQTGNNTDQKQEVGGENGNEPSQNNNLIKDINLTFSGDMFPSLIGNGSSIDFGDFQFLTNGNAGIITNITPQYIITGNGSHNIREDIFKGVPYMRDSESYSNRFEAIINKANNEGWPINVQTQTSGEGSNMKTIITYRYADAGDIRWNGLSSTLSDKYFIGLLTDYHIDGVNKDIISNVSYTSDDRRWTIKKDGIQIMAPVITTNASHELNFSDIYRTNGVGVYDVTCEQMATYTKSTYLKYSACDYLFDVSTGSVLWYSESLCESGNGRGIYLGDTTEDGWVKTDDSFIITVNDLSQFDMTSATGTERVD